MPDIDLTIVRAQYGDFDRQLHMRPAHKPEYLTNPLTEDEITVQGALKDCASAEQFMERIHFHWPGPRLTEKLTQAMRVEGARIKAQRGLTTAQVRELKADYLMRWALRMVEVVGVPKEWIRKWMRDIGCYDKKGKLRPEFGGNP